MNVLKTGRKFFKTASKPVRTISKIATKYTPAELSKKYVSTLKKALIKPRNPDFAETEDYYALMAQAAYQKDPAKFMEKKGYTVKVDPATTNKNWVTFIDDDGKAVVSYRGTQPTNWRDITTDVLIATGLESKGTRFQHAERDLKKVIETYGKENVSTTGHSLGGSLSLYAGSKQGVENYAYNPGIPKSKYVNEQSKIFVKGLDPVSNSVLFNEGVNRKAQVTVEAPTALNVHTIDQAWSK